MTPLTGERWRQIEEIYSALEAMPPDRREQRLLELEPPELAADVRALFAAVEGESAAQGQMIAAQSEQNLIAPQISGYNLVEPLGSGGAGVVYRASRLIEQGTGQPVALKVFHLHRAGEVDRQRFIRELGIVAKVDHPAIVKFFDGGFTSDGRPFLVMELVEGLPFTTYCNQNQLGLEDRLALLLEVFDAIAWAHARLIVHLDLKPSNILVTVHGTPKVLDFGSARLLDYTADLTVTQQITPQYASPERLRGESPTIASDVYSLGLLLFEVVSGGWPFASRDSIIALAERAANQNQPIPLSKAAADDHPFRRRLKGDLDAICAKALAYDAGERYITVNELAEDVRRFLDAKPVRAHAPGLGYRAGKFFRRYWARLSFATAMILMLSGSAIYSSIQASQARRSANQAERAIATFSDLLEGSNFGRSSGGREMTVRELLIGGEARILPMLATEPSVGADFASILAHGFIAQQDFKHARVAADQSMKLAEASGDDTRRAAAGAATARVFYHENRPNQAWEEAQRAFELWRANRSAFSPNRSLNLLSGVGGTLLYSKPSNPAAGEVFAHCLSIALPDTQHRADCLGGLANVAIYSRNAYAEALPMLAEAVAIRRRTQSPDTGLAGSLQAFGLANRFLARYAEDEAAQRESVALLAESNGPDSLMTANARAVWASSLAGVGNASLGLKEAERALGVYRQHFPKPGSNLLWTPLSAAMSNACPMQRFVDCERYAREGLLTLGSNPSARDNRRITAQAHLGWALARLGRPMEAKPLLIEAIEAYQQQNRRPLALDQLESALKSIDLP